ncbi:MAG: phosphatidylglycerophosphatase A [Gammaproteobacteria bacterium]|nr:phosphatidylglycerophosphatase A [Gammaproteobacteria bacterium]
MDPSAKTVFTDPAHLFAFGFGSGLAPFAPGTFGTAAAIPFYLLMQSLSLPLYLGLVLIAFIFGVWVCGKAGAALGEHDHGGIVWDEFVGFWVTMVAAPSGWQWIVAGFLLFRLFDIWKPWPINWADQQLSGGLGVMLDDLIAGLYALILLQGMARLVG